jgi:hypothetical protein
MGSQSTGIPTKQESKLGILEYTYTEAMPSRERERDPSASGLRVWFRV